MMRIYGVTHDVTTGAAIVRTPKSLKVGIGLPKGPAVHVFIEPAGTWAISVGIKDAKTTRCKTRAEAEQVYANVLRDAPARTHPMRLPYFTFLTPMPDGSYRHDFDAIERHGSRPTQIEIVFMNDTPLTGEFAMWSASKLQCHGDGLRGMRLLEMAKGPEELELARQAKEAGSKYFPVSTCFTGGCSYAFEAVENGKPRPPLCKLSTDLSFQPAGDLRLGTRAFFHTTGFASTSQLFASLYDLMQITRGRLIGMPCRLVLTPFKTNHNGQPGMQYKVHVEFRAEDMATLKAKLLEAALQFGPVGSEAPVQQLLTAPADVETEIDEGNPADARAITSEFYPDAVEDDDDGPAQSVTAEKTQASVDALKEQLATPAQSETIVDLKEKVRQKAASTARTTAAALNAQKSEPSPAEAEKPITRSPFD